MSERPLNHYQPPFFSSTHFCQRVEQTALFPYVSAVGGAQQKNTCEATRTSEQRNDSTHFRFFCRSYRTLPLYFLPALTPNTSGTHTYVYTQKKRYSRRKEFFLSLSSGRLSLPLAPSSSSAFSLSHTHTHTAAPPPPTPRPPHPLLCSVLPITVAVECSFFLSFFIVVGSVRVCVFLFPSLRSFFSSLLVHLSRELKKFLTHSRLVAFRVFFPFYYD